MGKAGDQHWKTPTTAPAASKRTHVENIRLRGTALACNKEWDVGLGICIVIYHIPMLHIRARGLLWSRDQRSWVEVVQSLRVYRNAVS